jgi:MFS family permease
MVDAAPGLLDARHRLTTVGLVLLITLVAFESMAVATAMPTAVADLDGLAWYGWPFTAFLVAQVIGMVVGGDVGDRQGARVGLLWGVGVFAVGLLACGLAADMALFVAGRAVQGFGGGLISVALYVVIGQAYDSALRPRLFGATAAAWVLPALIGPLVAGALTTSVGWRWVFLALLPLVLVGVVLVLPALRPLTVPADPPPARVARRWWAVLVGLGVGALQYAGQRLDAVGAVLAVAGLAALVAGLRPLLPVGTVRAGRGLPTVVAARGLLAGSFFGMDALLPLALGAVHGYSPTAAGIPLTAGAVGWAAASAVQGRHPAVSRVRLLRLGFVLVAVGLAGTAVIAVPGVGGWPAYLTWAVGGLGMGLGMPSVGVLLLAQSPEHRRGADSAALNVADVTASALCIGLTGVLVAAATAGLLPLRGVVVAVAGAYAALAVLGAVIAARAAAPAAAPDHAIAASTLAGP